MENLQNQNALSTDNTPTSTNVPTSNTKPTSIITKFTTNNKSKQPQVLIGCLLGVPLSPHRLLASQYSPLLQKLESAV